MHRETLNPSAKASPPEPHACAHEHEHAHTHEHRHGREHAHADESHAAHGHDACGHGTPASQPDVQLAPFAAKGALFRIPTMDCAAEEGEIRRALDGIDGLRGLRFGLAARTLAIDAPEASVRLALDAIRKAGFDPQPIAANADGDAAHAAGIPGFGRLGLALVFAIAAETLSFSAPDTLAFKLFGMALAAVAIGLAGLSVYAKGLAALRRGRLNISALMTVAVTGAFAIGQWPEAAMVMALYAMAEMVEARAVDRARNAIKSLMALAPDEAEVRQPDGSWARQPTRDVAIDATLRIRPGERVPLDGIITAGASALDQAPVTGESIPVDKAAGDAVYAGSINQTGALELRVTATASGSTLARIIHAVEQAQGSRAPTQRFVDRFAAVYTPAIFALALAVALLSPWLMDLTWLQAIYKALVLLVIACPCALVISTPVTVVSGLAAAARRGILIKGGAYLEQARQLKAFALDKTGTVTEGKPRLVAFEALQHIGDRPAPDALAGLARSLAARSDHPVSKAIAAGLAAGLQQVDDFSAAAGRGVQGRIAGTHYRLANARWIDELKLGTPAVEAALAAHQQAGRSVTLLADDRQVLALCAVADTIKPAAQAAIAALKALGVTPVMLTGDNLATARAVAQQAGIDEVQANLLPEEKLAAIAALQARLGPTAMTGDGINDAPALAQADIGFAMGGAGTHIAMEAADVVVMNDDLQRLPETIRLSRRTHAVLVQNIALTLGVKALFLALAVFGSASMWMAVFADMGTSLLVVANGLRLLRAQQSSA